MLNLWYMYFTTLKRKKRKSLSLGPPLAEGSCYGHPWGMRTPKVWSRCTHQSHGLPSRTYLLHYYISCLNTLRLLQFPFPKGKLCSGPKGQARDSCLQGSRWNLAYLAWAVHPFWCRMKPGMTREEGQTTGQRLGPRGQPSLGSCLLAQNFKSSENYDFDPGLQGHYEGIYAKMYG